MITFEPSSLALSQILLDPNNYRFRSPQDLGNVPEERIKEISVQSSAMDKLEKHSLGALRDSIRENGFVPVERIVVRPLQASSDNSENGEPGQFVVIEGNRRTAALKSLQKSSNAGATLPESVTGIFENVPVLIATDASGDDILSIMGIRHVGGPKEWEGYQGALLVKELLEKLSGENNATRIVANRLGLKIREVNRRLRAFELFEQYSNDEEFGDYARTWHYPLFHEVAAIPDVRDWLGFDNESIQFTDESNRETFYSWISSEDGTEKIRSFEDVRKLRTILGNEDAIDALKDDDQSLADAYSIAQSEAKAKRWEANTRAALKSMDDISMDLTASMTDEQIDLLRRIQMKAKKVVSAAEAMREADKADEFDGGND